MNISGAILNSREIIRGKAAVKAVLVVSFVVMTALGAYVRIPVPASPVPITLQTFFVVLCGALLGRKLAFFTQGAYVALGIFGMPVFQNYGAGLAHLMGPTGGYLAGFIAGAFIVGALINLKHAPSGFAYVVFSMSAGLLAVYACGICWLMFAYKFAFFKAVSLGFVPFIPGAVTKLIAASWIYSKIKVRMDEIL